ncbi:type III pantothenate kinase [Spirosoma montaniterrae]|uniref:Type III pantothenate kinase n=1 Tax=Spirosoma montaniterrae TaxID=1178516 RepID=A0A1P9WX81_9BACT|nr:type III pantothenate kinase [Spirosoma montaniterrae]AQG80002.1 type III pantothenate kinase [Spirosoma montaniterrae]
MNPLVPIAKPDVVNVVVDWGNSSLKVGWFIGPDQLETARYESPEALMRVVQQRCPAHVLVSSTSRSADEIRAGLRHTPATVWVLDSRTPVPIGKDYDTPATLGADRVAAAVGAATLFPGEDCLIFDLGTCLTADFVDRSAVFRGGLISPGLRMRFRAMHEQTARLPLIDLPDSPGNWPGLTAKNTRQAMQAGVVNGLAFEMNGIIDQYRREQPGIVVILCGGDAPTFESRLKPPIFAVPELVLIGLNRILRYNVENLQADTPDVNA